jgi:hypothetical protein
MKYLLPLTLTAALTAAPVFATTVSGLSTLNMSHSFVINGGQSPTGISINNLSSTYFVNSNATSAIDNPAAVQSETSNFVVGNPFSDPVVPVQAQRSVLTNVPGVVAGAVGQYNYTITMEDDPDDGDFDITRRAIDQTGRAEVLLDTDANPVEASGFSSHFSGRNFRFDNTTNDLISFNINGLFDARMTASIDDLGGIARTSGAFDMLFEVATGSSVTHFPIAPYITTGDEVGNGASTSEQLLLNSGGITGVSFGGTATAIGDGSETNATLDASTAYIFGISLEAGASLLMTTTYRQSNFVEYTPPPAIPPVPLPAGAVFMFSGIAALLGLRRRRIGAALPFPHTKL